MRSASEYFPMIKRGLAPGQEVEEDEQVVAVGWQHEVTSRKDREEALRDEVRRFESKVKKFYPLLEEGVDVTMWQLNQSAELGIDDRGHDFVVKSSAMTLKLHRRGDLLVQTVLTFNASGGYLSKALGRHRRDKAAIEPLSLNDILEVKAGCVGFDHAELPSASSKKGKSKAKADNAQSSLFLTIRATPTPLASARSYFFRLKSRSTRNDILLGMRGVLSDLQVHEGVSISSIHTPQEAQHGRRMTSSAAKNAGVNPFHGRHENGGDIAVPLEEVHSLINRERESYDRLLLTMLQGGSDLKEKEDELLALRKKLNGAMTESTEKDKIQANDSKLIMQLSKKLETLLMDNEDLRDQNDRLNQRLVTVECEKMNILAQQGS